MRTWSESVASQRGALGAGWKLGPERRRFSQHVCGQGIVRSGNEWKIISGKNIEGKRMAEIGSTVQNFNVLGEIWKSISGTKSLLGTKFSFNVITTVELQ